jgi:hypothetical protein
MQDCIYRVEAYGLKPPLRYQERHEVESSLSSNIKLENKYLVMKQRQFM